MRSFQAASPRKITSLSQKAHLQQQQGGENRSDSHESHSTCLRSCIRRSSESCLVGRFGHISRKRNRVGGGWAVCSSRTWKSTVTPFICLERFQPTEASRIDNLSEMLLLLLVRLFLCCVANIPAVRSRRPASQSLSHLKPFVHCVCLLATAREHSSVAVVKCEGEAGVRFRRPLFSSESS